MIIVDLVYNLSLLVAICSFSNGIDNRWRRNTPEGKIIQGVLFGAASIVAILRPFELQPGIIFDGRSVMLSLCGLVFGVVPALIASAMSIGFRLYQSGSGAITGSLVILTSAAIGCAFHSHLESSFLKNSTRNLVLFGLLVHVAMLLLMFTLPGGLGWEVVQTIVAPVIITYPLATLLAGKNLLGKEMLNRSINALTASEKKYKDLVENAKSIIVRWSKDGRIIAINRFGSEYFGYEENELTGKNVFETITPTQDSNGKPQGDIFENIVKDPDRYVYHENQNRRRGGDLVWISWTNTPIYDEEGRVTEYLSVGWDITDRKTAEAALNESETRLRAIFEATPDIILTVDGDLRIRTINRIPQIMRDEDLVDRPIEDLFMREYSEKIKSALRLIFKSPDAPQEEIMIRQRNDPEVWYALRTAPIIRSGEVAQVVVIITDISARIRAEVEARESAMRFNHLVEIAPDAIFVLTGEKSTYVNPAALKIMGAKTLNDLLGKSVLERVAPEYRRAVEQNIQVMNKRRGTISRMEAKFMRMDGSSFDAESSSVSFNYRGEESAIIFLRDITERRIAEDALRESEMRFRQLADAIQETFWLKDARNGKITYASPAFERIWGVPMEELYHDPGVFRRSIHPDDLARIMDIQTASVENGRFFDEEHRIIRPDGEIRWVRARFYPVNQADGLTTHFACIAEDITERKQITEKVLESQKMADLGTIAAGIAHEINTPLQVITGTSDSLNEMMRAEVPLENHYLEHKLEIISSSAWRIAEIVHSLNVYARSGSQGRQPQAINELVREALVLMEHQVSSWSRVTLEQKLADDLPAVLCDRSDITQALINLLSNARDAMPSGGVITLRTAFDAERQSVLLEVADNGEGILPELRSKIFTPFFTTKQGGSGTGLGLAIVQSIMTRLGGSIEIDSTPGIGTSVRLYFPTP